MLRVLAIGLLACACVPPKPAPQEVEVPPPVERAEVAPTAFALTVSPERVDLDGKFIESLASLPAGTLARLDELFARLKDRHAAGTHGEYTLAVAGSVPGWKWKSAFQTAAFAGFPVARLSGSQADFVLAAMVPQPPGKEHVPDPRTSVVLAMYRDHVLVTSFSDGARVLPPTTTKPSELSSAIAQICPRGVVRCVDQVLLYSANDLPFSEVEAALVAIGAKSNDARVVLAVQPPSEELVARYFDPAVKRLRVTTDMVIGTLPPEVIQATIRQAYPKFRACYEDGLGRDPKLTGSVVVRFVIQRDGSVGPMKLVRPEDNAGAGTTMPDANVTYCILAEYKNLTFQAPEGGIVTVVYPIQFSPEE